MPEKVTEKMLQSAVKKAVEVELIRKYGNEREIAENWERIKAVLQAALDEARPAPSSPSPSADESTG